MAAYDPYNLQQYDPYNLQQYSPWLDKASITTPAGKDIYDTITSAGLDPLSSGVGFNYSGLQSWNPMGDTPINLDSLYSGYSLDNPKVLDLYTQALGQTQDTRLQDAYKSAMGFDQYKPDPYENTSFGSQNYGLSVGQLGLDFSKMFESPEFANMANTWATEQSTLAQQKDARADLMNKLYTDPNFTYTSSMDDWKSIAKYGEDYVSDWYAKNPYWNTSFGGDSFFNMPPNAAFLVGYHNGVPVYANAAGGAPTIGPYYSVDSSGKLTYGVGREGKGSWLSKAARTLLTGGIGDLVAGEPMGSGLTQGLSDLMPEGTFAQQVVPSLLDPVGAANYDIDKIIDAGGKGTDVAASVFERLADPTKSVNYSLEHIGEELPEGLREAAPAVGGVVGGLIHPGFAALGAGIGSHIAGKSSADSMTNAGIAGVSSYLFGGDAWSDLLGGTAGVGAGGSLLGNSWGSSGGSNTLGTIISALGTLGSGYLAGEQAQENAEENAEKNYALWNQNAYPRADRVNAMLMQDYAQLADQLRGVKESLMEDYAQRGIKGGGIVGGGLATLDRAGMSERAKALQNVLEFANTPMFSPTGVAINNTESGESNLYNTLGTLGSMYLYNNLLGSGNNNSGNDYTALLLSQMLK